MLALSSSPRELSQEFLLLRQCGRVSETLQRPSPRDYAKASNESIFAAQRLVRGLSTAAREESVRREATDVEQLELGVLSPARDTVNPIELPPRPSGRAGCSR